MIALFTFFSVLVVSLVVTKIATVALMQTGLSRGTARFQARSAFSGAGFTTKESEAVVNHPVRRRIVMLLILAGNAGIVTAVSSLILSFAGADTGTPDWLRAIFLGLGLLTFYFVATSGWVDRVLSRLILTWMSRRGKARFLDYARLLETEGGYGVVELQANSYSWLKNRKLGELRLKDEGVLVLGIHRFMV